MSMWLTDDELIVMTGYRRQKEQKKALAELRVQFKSRPADGFPLVLRSHVEADTKPSRRQEPNYV